MNAPLARLPAHRDLRSTAQYRDRVCGVALITAVEPNSRSVVPSANISVIFFIMLPSLFCWSFPGVLPASSEGTVSRRTSLIISEASPLGVCQNRTEPKVNGNRVAKTVAAPTREDRTCRFGPSASRAGRRTRRSSHLPPTRPTATMREGWRIWPALASSSPCM